MDYQGGISVAGKLGQDNRVRTTRTGQLRQAHPVSTAVDKVAGQGSWKSEMRQDSRHRTLGEKNLGEDV
jgi:hypothetical protein